ncbi:hypothetical protein [Virgibacillus necropolis]|uniref:Uncharacterized protein n=1 Tax=Virgibacillus necropolis TaxID=163877 RepID=A0A221MCF3_9BACI|nr:hypothetical protein [Virgibacillus necropolis]ASN05307.1 hypothetical protein CFK40_09925 [Virgibacillus necropolis]
MKQTQTIIRLRRFRATAIRQDDCTGIGVVEENDNHETIAIYSVNIDGRLSNRETFKAIAELVKAEVNEGEIAKIKATSVQVKSAWLEPYRRQVIIRSYRMTPDYKEVIQLAEDAAERKSSISEKF